MTHSRGKYLWIALTIIFWYSSSSMLIASNKVLFDLLDIEIPLLVTFVHFSITSLILAAGRSRRPDLVGCVQVSSAEFIFSILPVAVCTAGDVGLSNMAYSRVPVSVMTILKSSAPVCIYTAAVLVGLERFRLRTSLLCFLITASIALAVPNSEGLENDSNGYVAGIAMVVVSVACLSVRWVLIQSLTRKYSPIQLLYLIQPTSALVLLPFALLTELNVSLGRMLETHSMVIPSLLIFGSSFAAMGLLLCEYKIVHDTTSLTLSIAGIGKELLTLTLSVVVFSENFTLRQIVAVSFSICGILLYGILRSKQPLEEVSEYHAASNSSPAKRRHSVEMDESLSSFVDIE